MQWAVALASAALRPAEPPPDSFWGVSLHRKSDVAAAGAFLRTPAVPLAKLSPSTALLHRGFSHKLSKTCLPLAERVAENERTLKLWAPPGSLEVSYLFAILLRVPANV